MLLITLTVHMVMHAVRAMSTASMMMSAAEAMAKACRMVNPPQMVLYVITVSIVKYDLIESSAAKPNLIVSGPPEKNRTRTVTEA